MKTYRIRSALLALAVHAVLFAAVLADEPRPVPHYEALCDTDSDCMRLCDPADEQCDGGPQ